MVHPLLAPPPPEWDAPQAIYYAAFVRALGVVYMIAFTSLYSQIAALAGPKGVTPARKALDAKARHFPTWWRFAYFPTVLWATDCSEKTLEALCRSGCVISLFVALGVLPGWTSQLLGACWALYLSLDSAVELGMPWDCLLLEAGFLAAWLPAVGGSMVRLAMTAAPSPVVAFLLRWLLFRLMFGFGLAKFRGSDSFGRDSRYICDFLVAQPIPSPLALLMARLPPTVHRLLLLGLAVAELLVPFLYFVPGARVGAAAVTVALQLGIAASGAYGWFNLLTAVLCVPLLDTQSSLYDVAPAILSADSGGAVRSALLSCGACAAWLLLGVLHLPFGSGMTFAWAFLPDFALAQRPWVRTLTGLVRAMQPFRLLHGYGVFPPHTAAGVKVVAVFEGEDEELAELGEPMDSDGLDSTWHAYEWKWAVSDPAEAPSWVSPHQPRLDYQFFYDARGLSADNFQAGFFRANSPYSFCPTSLAKRVAQGLLAHRTAKVAGMFVSPFAGGAAPRRVRCSLYLYEPATDGGKAWWKRRRIGTLLPPQVKDPKFFLTTHLMRFTPELFHPEHVIWRERAAHAVADGRLRGDAGRNGEGEDDVSVLKPAKGWLVDQRAISMVRGKPGAHDGGLGKAELAAAWEFVRLAREAWEPIYADLRATAARLRQRPQGKGAVSLWKIELVLSRLVLRLVKALAPHTWHPNAQVRPRPGLPSYFAVHLAAWRVVLDGPDTYRSAINRPDVAAARLLEGACVDGTWAVEELAPAPGKALGKKSAPPERLTASGAMWLLSLFRTEELCLHGLQYRLLRQIDPHNALSHSTPGAGWLELVDWVAATMPAARDELLPEIQHTADGDWVVDAKVKKA